MQHMIYLRATLSHRHTYRDVMSISLVKIFTSFYAFNISALKSVRIVENAHYLPRVLPKIQHTNTSLLSYLTEYLNWQWQPKPQESLQTWHIHIYNFSASSGADKDRQSQSMIAFIFSCCSLCFSKNWQIIGPIKVIYYCLCGCGARHPWRSCSLKCVVFLNDLLSL